MSKNFKNYPDPKEMLEKFGGDALRLYLMGSPVMNGEDILISEEQYRNQVRGMMLILWNVYNFFIQNALIDDWTPGEEVASENVLDQWLVSLLHGLVRDVTKALDSYDTVVAIDQIKVFVDNFSTWYLRRSRDRVGPNADDDSDKNAFYATSYEVLVTLTKLLAPIAPFISESIYKNLTDEESVHLSDWPAFDDSKINRELEEQMELARRLVEVGHSLRKELGIKLRQPLERAWHDEPKKKISNIDVLHLVLGEVNVKYWINNEAYDEFEKKMGLSLKILTGLHFILIRL